MKNLTRFILGIILIPVTQYLYGQNHHDTQKILEVTRVIELKKLSAELSKQFVINHDVAVREARSKGWILRKTDQDGRCIELAGLGHKGKPVYFLTSNLTAAKTISANKVWTGGGSGLNLSGLGITLREWDESGVRLTHQELTGRVVQGDAASYFALHSTHVAGTMMAAGIVGNARGMSNQSTLRAFDWSNDYSEMATEAANGALLSNSSYIYITGWYNNGASWYWFGDPAISTSEDYGFGFYSSSAAIVDSITYYAPYYLPCKAVGNDRGEGPSAQPVSHYEWDGSGWILSSAFRNPDGMPSGYDCIASGWGVSKNVLSVGAVLGIPSGYSSPADVQLASFSGTGPADDGRIKPDVVADGVGLYSTGSSGDNSYTTMSGTSMATPGTTGSLALLQEHHHNLHGNYLRSATLKGIVIHTADEAGNAAGPDYQFGWGLLNINNAAAVIGNSSTAMIRELTLDNGETYSLSIKSNGTESLKATLCWTDPQGTPPPDAIDPALKMLVNDLDVRIDGQTYKPWILNPSNPGASATNGDNTTDNVEQINIPGPGAGCHTLTVSHKGTLSGGTQLFSLIVTGISLYSPFVQGSISGNQFVCANATPSLLTSTSPSGGSSPYTYQWQSSPDSIIFSDINGATGSSYQPGILASTTFFRQKQSSQSSCSSAFTNIIKITVNPVPSPTISGNSVLCENSGNYNYSSEPGMTAYQWSVSSGGLIAGGQGTNVIQVSWIQPGDQTVFLTCTNASGCSPGTPSALPVTVNPLPGPALMISGSQTVCAESQGISYSILPVQNSLTYIWTIPPGCSITSGQSTNSIEVDFSEYAASGIFQVYGNNLCGDGLPSPALPVNVFPIPPTPEILQQGDSLVSDSPEGNQWSDENGIIPGATSSVYKPDKNGLYSDVVTLNGCNSAPSAWFNYVATFIDDKDATAPLVYPNPADQIIHIHLKKPTPDRVVFELVSLTGKTVKTLIRNNCTENGHLFDFPCHDVNQGIYWLTIQTSSEKSFRKIIIYRHNGIPAP